MGCFARTTRRKVAHQNNREIKTCRPEYLFVVQVIAERGCQPINKDKRRKQYF